MKVFIPKASHLLTVTALLRNVHLHYTSKTAKIFFLEYSVDVFKETANTCIQVVIGKTTIIET